MAKQGINEARVLGRLGGEVEVRHMPNGEAVASFSVCTGETWKDKQTGEKKEKSEWHKVTAFGVLAEFAGNWLRKGKRASVKGSLRTRKWTDQSGVERWTTEIIADEILPIDWPEKDDQPQSGAQAASQETPRSAPRAPAGADFEDEQIPF